MPLRSTAPAGPARYQGVPLARWGWGQQRGAACWHGAGTGVPIAPTRGSVPALSTLGVCLEWELWCWCPWCPIRGAQRWHLLCSRSGDAAPTIRSLGAPHVPVPSPARRLSSEGFILTPSHTTSAKGWSWDGDLGGPRAAQSLSSNPAWPHPHPAGWVPGPGGGAGCCAWCMVPQGSLPPGKGVCEGKRGRAPALFARGRQTPVTQPAAAFLPAPDAAPPGPCAWCRGTPSTGHGDAPAPGAGTNAVTLQRSSSTWRARGAGS